jgi:hypothetical protein
MAVSANPDNTLDAVQGRLKNLTLRRRHSVRTSLVTNERISFHTQIAALSGKYNGPTVITSGFGGGQRLIGLNFP